MPEEKFTKKDRKALENILLIVLICHTLSIGYIGLQTMSIMNMIDQPYKVQTKNVIGKKAPEKFYEINGNRVYLEIDGKPVEEYFRK